jgi:hypothetical protein
MMLPTPKTKEYLELAVKYQSSDYADEYLDRLDELWYSMNEDEINYVELELSK